MTPSTPPNAFTLITVVPEYAHEPWCIPKAREHRQRVVDTLTRYGAQHQDWSEQATTTDIRKQWEAWTTTPGASVIYWLGHGTSSDEGYLATLADTVGCGVEPHAAVAAVTARNSWSDRDLATALRDRVSSRTSAGERDAWVLLILDTCHSRFGARQVWTMIGERRPEYPDDLGVIGTSTGDGFGFSGWFPDLLERKLDGFTGNDEDGIRLRELLRRVAESETGVDLRANKDLFETFRHEVVLPHPAGTLQPVTATCSDYEELEMLLADTDATWRNHFLAKARGTEATPAWHFTGRLQVRAALAAWLATSGRGMQVLTGVAGSGKSAVLGMLLASSHPGLVEKIDAVRPASVPPECRPPENVFDAVLHLSGRTIHEVRELLAASLDVTADDLDALVAAVNARAQADRPFTLLADALDESRDPFVIAALLRRLARQRQVRVLVGTRRSLNETPDQPAPDQHLLDALVDADTVVTTLDRDPDAVRDYVRSRLLAELGSPVLQPEAVSTAVARGIAAADQPFLFARLAVHEVLDNPALQVPDPDLTDLVAGGHDGLFARAVARLRDHSAEAEALLHALAYSRGNGFPRTGGIWAIGLFELDRARVPCVVTG